MDGVIDLTFWQMVFAYVIVVVLIILVRIKGIAREKDILLASIRMSLQLFLTGYVLVYIFDNPSPWFTLGILFLMECFAVYNIIKRAKVTISKKLKYIIAISMVTGTTVSICYFLFAIIQITPWYYPRYFIPIAGMLIGNSMTGISLGVNRLVDGMKTKRHIIEGALMLGAKPHHAAKTIVDDAFDAAILPTINSMLGMGIIFLPGMMTGQILSGTSPITAIAYQIAIMLGILGSVTLTVFIFLQLGYKTYFNKKQQLQPIDTLG